MTAIGITTTVRTVADEAASLIAPAALVASVVSAGMPEGQRSLRVLVLGRDPMFRLDNGRWLSYAKDFIGNLDDFEALTLIDEDAKTSLAEVVERLNRPPATFVTADQVMDGSCGQIDLALWVHPVSEINDEDGAFQAKAAAKLAADGVPVFASHFNEVDHIAQSVITSPSGWEFALLTGQQGSTTPYINRYGIALTGTGVRGGWGAMMSRLVPATIPKTETDVAAVRCAFALMRAEGGGQSGWTLGDSLASVAGGGSRVIGLLGDMALDTQYGRVFTLHHDGNVLHAIGQLWNAKLMTKPDNLSDLIVWASRLYLNFAFELPPADKDQKAFIAALQDAIDAGLVEGGIGLARCYEASRSQALALESDRLYRRYAEHSPLAAYYVAYKVMDQDPGDAMLHFTRAADQGYPHALCDLGLMLSSEESTIEQGVGLLSEAAKLGDVVAIYHLGIRDANAGDHTEAKTKLKVAVELGDSKCADLFLHIVESQIRSGAGERTRLKREQSWVRERIKKIRNHEQTKRA